MPRSRRSSTTMASRIGPITPPDPDQLLADAEDVGLDVGVAGQDRLLDLDDPLADGVKGWEEGVDQLVQGHVEQVAGPLAGQLGAGLDPAGHRPGIDRGAAVEGEQVVRPGDEVDLDQPGRPPVGRRQGGVEDQHDLAVVLLDLGPLALPDLQVLEGDLVDAELPAEGGQLLGGRRGGVDPDQGPRLGPDRPQVGQGDVGHLAPVPQHAHLDHGWPPSIRSRPGAAGSRPPSSAISIPARIRPAPSQPRPDRRSPASRNPNRPANTGSMVKMTAVRVGDTSRWARVWMGNAPAEATTEVMARATHTSAEEGTTRSSATAAQTRASSPAVPSWTTASR